MQIIELTATELDQVTGGTTEITVTAPRPRDTTGSQGRSRSGIGDASSAPAVDYRNPEANTGRHSLDLDPNCIAMGFATIDCVSSR